MKTTEQKNRMIAEFMGFKLQADPNERFFNQWFTKPTNAWVGRIEILHFDSSWDWLMPVVEKISKLGYEFQIDANETYFKECDDDYEIVASAFNGSLQENTFEAVVQFIEWYNEQK